MATAKVTINNRTIMDITDTTATASTIVQGYTAYGADGVKVTGTYQGGGGGGNLQAKTDINPTTSSQTITPDTGYDGLSSVQINAMPAGSVTAPASISGSSASITTGTNSLILTKTVSVTPNVTTAGYVSSGTAGNSSVSLTALATIQGATTYTPTTSSQTIPMGTYLTGAQTIEGDTDLVAGNIKNGVTIFGVEGTYSGQSINNQAKTFTPDETGAEITPDTGYTGLSKVTVSAIPTTYVGSGITRRSSTDLTASGATVTVPAGYYSTQATKSVTSGSVTAPSSISGTSASISTGTNTLTLTKTVSVTPNVTTAGYVSSGTAGNSSVSLTASVTVNPTPTASGATVTVPAGYYTTQTTKSVSSGSATGPSSITQSSATVTTGTNTITLTKTGVSTTPTVSAGYVSSATSSTATVALTASVTTKAAATITPTTSNQTIASGTYLTGTQTIAGDADLVASNIVSTANIFGVQGSVVINKYYTGSSAPSSSLGNNGDIYLQS